MYDAGRGWYSALAEPVVLDSAPVRELEETLRQEFPLVGFSCWSTAEVQAAMHHLLGTFVSFVMVEADAMEPLYSFLQDAGWDAWLNPRGREAERFAPGERTVVIRRASSKTPAKESRAPIEQLLVDLYFEVRALRLMSEENFRLMVANLAGTRRIRMALLLSYAAGRKVKPADLLGKENTLIPPNQHRRNKSIEGKPND
ncbi:MAG: DUF6577 family protein [Rectinemataceae bacterium]